MVTREDAVKCCASQNKEKYDLVILGSGSASFAAALSASELGKSVAMIEQGTLGGTCVNVGCVPSETLIRAAGSRFRGGSSPFKGLSMHLPEVDFQALIQEKDGLVETLRKGKYENVLSAHDAIELIEEEAKFISPTEVQAGSRILTGECFLVATGASAWTPPVPGLSEVDFNINNSV